MAPRTRSGSAVIGVTDADGLARCSRVILASELLGLLTTDLGLRITGSYAGEPGFLPSSDTDFRNRLIRP